MKYAAIHRSVISAGAWANASDHAIGAWTRLSVLASDVESGQGETTKREPIGYALILGCADWTDRAWLVACGTDGIGVKSAVAAGLAEWDGRDLKILGFDSWGQKVAESHRTAGLKGGRKPSANQLVAQGLTKREPLQGEAREGEAREGADPDRVRVAGDVAQRWLRAFGSAWIAIRGGLHYGQPGDAKATGVLADVLKNLSPEESFAAWKNRESMFAAFFADSQPQRAGYRFAWFVQRWEGLRLAPEAKSYAQRVVESLPDELMAKLRAEHERAAQ